MRSGLSPIVAAREFGITLKKIIAGGALGWVRCYGSTRNNVDSLVACLETGLCTSYMVVLAQDSWLTRNSTSSIMQVIIVPAY